MKYLDDFPELSELSELLAYSSAELKVRTRFEVYSCKSVSRERKLFKSLEEAHSLEQADLDNHMAFSPENREATLDSCFGRLDQKDSRQTWFWLIALLNVAFPDHDFTQVRPDHFVRENSVQDVLRQLSATVLELSAEGPRSYGSYPPSIAPLSSSPFAASSFSSTLSSPSVPAFTHPHLSRVLDSVLQGTLSDCDVFSYTPDIDSDPHAESSEDDSDDDDELDDDGGLGSALMDGSEDFLEGFEDDGYHSGGRRRSEGSSRRGRRSNDGGNAVGGFDDDEGDFEPPSLNSLPLVGGRGKPTTALNDTTRRGCLWSVNYFFVSRRQKRILFCSIWAKKRALNLYSPTTYTVRPMALPTTGFASSVGGKSTSGERKASGSKLSTTGAADTLGLSVPVDQGVSGGGGRRPPAVASAGSKVIKV